MITSDEISDIISSCFLSSAETEELLHQSDRLETVDSVLLHKYAAFFTSTKGEKYQPRITSRAVFAGTLFCIEPECGSTTYAIDLGGSITVIDSGYPCFQDELKAVLARLFPDFERREKNLILTHMDMDHAGLLSCFDTIFMSRTTYDDFVRRREDKPNLREKIPKRCPYYRISSIFSKDHPADTDNMVPISDVQSNSVTPLTFIGRLQTGGLDFEVYETSGGHVEGSIILFERACRLVFAGDTFVNTDMHELQKEFIRSSIEVLGSLNADSKKAKVERARMYELMGDEQWILCGGHGGFFDYPADGCKESNNKTA